jgi:ABC-2 type transport system permease protein
MVEVDKIVRRPLNQIVLSIFLALLVVVYVLLWMASGVIGDVSADADTVTRIRSSLYLQETVPFAILMLYAFGFLSGVVVIGANTGAEYTWNTIRTLSAAEPRRWRLLLAKILALWVLVVAGMVLGMIVMLATSSVITLVAGEFSLSFVDAEYIRDSIYSFGRLILATAPYFALAAMLGVIGRSATAGIALAIGVAFLEGIVGGLMSLAGGWVAEIPRFMLDANADTLAMAGGGQLNELFDGDSALGAAFDRPGVWHASIVLLGWTAAFVAAAFWAIRRQDLHYRA